MKMLSHFNRTRELKTPLVELIRKCVVMKRDCLFYHKEQTSIFLCHSTFSITLNSVGSNSGNQRNRKLDVCDRKYEGGQCIEDQLQYFEEYTCTYQKGGLLIA